MKYLSIFCAAAMICGGQVMSQSFHTSDSFPPGRTLAADTSWVDDMNGVEYQFHVPAYYAGNPIIKADKP